MKNKPEDLLTRVYFDAEQVEVRDENGKKTVRGYAAMFEKMSVKLYDYFREKIRAGAFANSLKKNNIRALWNHNSDFVLGSTKAGTLRLDEDEKGLRFELDLPNSTAGNDAYESISRGDVDGMSFGFRVLKQEWDESKKDDIVRTLIEVDLREVSPTAFPAYPATSVKARSIADDYEELKEIRDSERVAAENDLKLKTQRIRELTAENS